MNHILQQFKDSVQIILVGKEDPYIKPLYEKVRKSYKLELAAAFDTKTFVDFGVATVPHLIWIDDLGVVRAITSTSEVLEK